MRGLSSNPTPRETSLVVNELVRGNGGDIELSTGTSTTLNDHRISERSRIFLQAKDSGSASATVYVSAISKGSATIAHGSGGSGRMMDYVIVG